MEDYPYEIRELAREFKTTSRALRLYEEQGLLKSNKSKWSRRYSEAGRARVSLIIKLKKMGFTLRDISTFLDAQDGESSEAVNIGAEVCAQKIAELKDRLAEIDEAIAELRQEST